MDTLTPIKEALSFDDVVLVPQASTVLPGTASVETRLTRTIGLGVPLLSAAMDTVTEAPLAIAMAQAGGMGVIHKNVSPEEQAAQVARVKKFESGMVVNPLTIDPNAPLSEALHIKETHSISGIPVVERDSNKLVGILTNRDIRFTKDPNTPVRTLMTRHTQEKPLITVDQSIERGQAMDLLHEHRIEKLLVVDDDFRCVGLITVRDIERAQQHPHACKDSQGRLRVAAAVGVGEDGIERAQKVLDAGADIIVVDTAHGHSQGVIHTVKALRAGQADAQIIAGNIATPEGALALIEAGADAIKVGIGPGTICTTRIIAGVGVPQLSAIMETATVCHAHDIPLIGDGGIKTSGDIAKAIAGGADCVMIGSLFAGTDEAPGEIFLHQGRSYKAYRGMGSLGAMARGSADRYFQQEISDTLKMVPEGIEGQVPYKGPLAQVIHQLVGGLKSSMGYTGNKTITDLKSNATFRRITAAGIREGHVHDVTITREAPNYRTNL